MGGKSTAKAPKLERDKRIYRNSIGNSLVNLGKYQTGQHVLSLEKTGWQTCEKKPDHTGL